MDYFTFAADNARVEFGRHDKNTTETIDPRAQRARLSAGQDLTRSGHEPIVIAAERPETSE